MAFDNPSIEDFKVYFERDFVYGNTNETVKDEDLVKARDVTICSINQGLFKNQLFFNIGFFYLMAHFLVCDLNAATQGTSGKATWHRNSHSVGSVSESFTIPQSISENPYFSMITTTSYGQKYFQLIYPQLIGQVFIVEGATRA